MADKAIYSVDTVTSMSGTDKVYVNTGNNIKQITKDNLCGNAIREINDNLSSEISRAKEADEILKSRVDVITSLPEGSTTGDAELQDIRVKADGTTATSAGNAVREQISELKSDFSELKSDLINKTLPLNVIGKLTKGGYPNPFNNGEIEPNEGFYYTDFIAVNKFSPNYFANNVAFLCWYDENKNYIPSVNPKVYNNEKLPMDNASYFRLATDYEKKDKCYVFNCTEEEFNNYVIPYNMEYIVDNMIDKSEHFTDFDFKEIFDISNRNTYYNIDYGSEIKVNEYASNGWVTIKPIRLKSGTYVYSNIYGYFSITANDLKGSNPTRLSGDTSNKSGSFTIENDKYLWITTTDLNNASLVSNLLRYDKLQYLLDYKNDIENIVYCGANKEFNTLKSAIEEAVKTKGTTLYIGKGVYNLLDEFGEEYFNNLTNASEKAGLWLYNDIHIIFEKGSKVVCNYSGTNDNVKKFFSPFNSGDDTKHGGFIIENLNLECANVRYCVHDEHVNDRVPYCQRYINCTMKLDNTNNSVWTSAQCIGGGLGGYGDIEFKGCIFNSILNGGSTNTAALSYHNTRYVEDAKSVIRITGCYFQDYNTIGIYSYGDTTEYSDVIINNNSLGSEIDNMIYDNWHENIKVLSWNNNIRN